MGKICWRCSCQEKEDGEDQSGDKYYLDVAKEDMREVGARKD